MCMRERSGKAENKNKDKSVTEEASAEVDYSFKIEKENMKDKNLPIWRQNFLILWRLAWCVGLDTNCEPKPKKHM